MLMPQEKVKKIHLIYGCVATVLIVALGIALIVSCWGIYQSGPRAYSRASIGEKLQQICVLIYLAAAVIVGGFVLNILIPLERPKTKAVRDELATMKKLAVKAGVPSGEESAAIQKEQKLRKLWPAITAINYALLLIWPAIYMFNKASFSGADPTAEILKASLIVLPFALIGLVLCHVCSEIITASIVRQTAIYKQMIAANKGQTSPLPERKKKAMPLVFIRCAILVIAVVFIVVGIFNGSANDVLAKAIKICTECIGLG